VSKVANYLQEHLMGEVTDALDVRGHFSRDASILEITPSIVVYPRNESDVRKTCRFAWQLAERGRALPITARGGGSDTTGAAIGSGILMVFKAHMNRILVLDPKKQFVTTEPGITYDKLEQALYTHGLFLPPYPASAAYATVGGGLANNSIGEKSVKYGDTQKYVKELRVVLANGEVIEVGPISKRELNRKLGLTTFEGDVYRAVDSVLEENSDLIKNYKAQRQVIHERAGYNIFDVKTNGSFNLAPLFLGSQGTLGIITEANLKLEHHNPVTQLGIVSLENLNDLNDVLPKVLKLKPSICEMINKAAILEITRLNPNQLNGVLESPLAGIHLIIEFDDSGEGAQKKAVKAVQKIVAQAGGHYQLASNEDEKEKIWKLHDSINTILEGYGNSKAVPVAEDVSVPVHRLAEFLHKANEVYSAVGLPAAAWGHAGEAVVRMQPILDIGQLGDRQKLFRISDAIYHLALTMGGSISAAAGDGRVRAPYTARQYDQQLYQVMMQIKRAFDPHGILNRGVKTVSPEVIKSLISNKYDQSHRHEHLRRS
jgi:FAD/FMN-containing dehydrogenase